MTFDLYALQWRTESNREAIEHTEARVKQMRDDPDRDKRRAQRECVWCWYRSSFAGQAFTEWTCRGCDARDTHANTAVPMLCRPCSEKYDVCRNCGADLDLKRRKKLVKV